MTLDRKRELNEAIRAGNIALESLGAAFEQLKSASNWGVADMFFGGTMTTFFKHSKIDKARRNMEEAKYNLRTFSKELSDVNKDCNLNINTADFLVFADYFFDNFFVDWAMQSRISKAKDEVAKAIEIVNDVLDNLEDELNLINE